MHTEPFLNKMPEYLHVSTLDLEVFIGRKSVSYTHLDVYKRQAEGTL